MYRTGAEKHNKESDEISERTRRCEIRTGNTTNLYNLPFATANAGRRQMRIKSEDLPVLCIG